MDELFSGIIPIIVIIAVINIIVGVMKRKAKARSQQQRQDGQHEQPQPRQTGMSDIQRAFMMMSGLDEEEPKPKPYVHGEGFAGRVEGRGSHEGTPGRVEGRGSHEGTPGRVEGRGSHEGTPGRVEGRGSHEGTHGLSHAAATRSAPAPVLGKYAKVKINNYFMDEADDDQIVVQKREPKFGKLKLFENQNDYAKAVIYSEILTRRSARR